MRASFVGGAGAEGNSVDVTFSTSPRFFAFADLGNSEWGRAALRGYSNLSDFMHNLNLATSLRD
jgi:hypothetical protein